MIKIDPEIIEKWQKTGLLDGLGVTKASHMARILENQRIFNTNEDIADMFSRISIPMLRRIYSGLQAHDWVNVQSLYGADDTTELLGIKTIQVNGSDRYRLFTNEFALEVTDRTSKVSWSPVEAMQDLKLSSLDVQAELTAVNAIESSLEIDRMILKDIMEVAPRMVISRDAFEADPAIFFNKLASKVFKNSRRGSANWMVATPNNLNKLNLEEPEGFGIIKRYLRHNPDDNSIMRRMHIYEDRFFYDNRIVAGYRGNMVVDAGYTYALGYIDQTERPLDPNAFCPPHNKFIFTEAKVMSDPNFFIVGEIV